MMQHFSKLGHTPFWHLCVPKGAEMTSLRGGETFAPLPAGFRRLLWPPLSEHYQLLCLSYKSRGIVVGSVQTVAAIANDESLQVRVRKSHPPEGC